MSWNDRVQEDLAALRRMADSGGRLTLPGGEFYILWGIAVGIGFVGTYLIAFGFVPVPPAWIAAVWAVVNVAGGIGSYFLARRTVASADSARLANRIVSVVWLVSSVVMASYFLTNVVTGKLHGWMLAATCPFFAAVAFMVIGFLCNLRFMAVAGVGWLILGVAMMALPFTAATVPLFAVCFVALMVVTGLKMLALEREVGA